MTLRPPSRGRARLDALLVLALVGCEATAPPRRETDERAAVADEGERPDDDDRREHDEPREREPREAGLRHGGDTRERDEGAPDEGSDEGAVDDAAPRDCTAGETVPLGTEPARAIAVASSEHGRLVVLDRAEGGFIALAADDGAEGATARREIPRARGEIVLSLEPAGDRFLLLGRAPCTSAGLATECIVARSISVAGGITSGPPLEVALPERIRTMRIATSRSLLYLARSHAGAPPGLERFEVGDDGLVTHVRRALGEAIPEDEPVEILGLVADGAGWAVLYRHGATEDARSAVVLATQLDEHEVGELHDALLVEAMAWVGTSLAMIVAFEFARPSWVRVGADGEVLTAPRALPPRGEPPLPFAGRRTAHIVGHAGARALEVRDAMGDRVGERIVLGAGTADAARTSEGFLVALLSTDGAVSLRTITCP